MLAGCSYSPSTWEVWAGGPEVKDHPSLPTQLEFSLAVGWAHLVECLRGMHEVILALVRQRWEVVSSRPA